MDPELKSQAGSVTPDSKVVDDLILLSKKRSSMCVKEEIVSESFTQQVVKVENNL